VIFVVFVVKEAMRCPAFVLLGLIALIQGSSAQAPSQAPVAQPAQQSPAPRQTAPPRPATMKEMMADLLFPTADVIFYVARGEPKDDAEWYRIQLNALMLGEIAYSLTTPARAYDQGQWMKDAKLLQDVGAAAYRAAQTKDYETLVELNDELYEACQSCHEHYRPGYRRRP
jgi:cytochrome c556